MASFTGEILKKIDPHRYFDQFLSEGVYPDGRDISQFRVVSIEQSVDSRAYGSSYVQQNGACVLCTADLSLAPTSNEAAILWEIDALECIPKKLVEETHASLTRIIDSNHLVDPQALKLEANSNNDFELQWSIHLRITIISANGFLIGAALTAIQVTLLDITLPCVEYIGSTTVPPSSSSTEGIEEGVIAPAYEEEEVALQFDITKVKVLPDKEGRRLEFKDILVHTPFLLYKSAPGSSNASNDVEQGITLLCDPTNELCDLIDDRCDVTIGADGCIYALRFSSSPERVPLLREETLNRIITIAQDRHAVISNELKKRASR